MSKELEAAVAAVKAAGEVLRNSFGQHQEVTYKGEVDLVTKADENAEQTIKVAALTSPWLRERAGIREFDYDLYKQLRNSLRELRPVFLSLKETYDAGEESREWEKLVEDYNKLRYAELDEEYFAPWTPLQVLDDLARRYKVWELEETPLWKRTVEKLGLEGSVQRDANVLHVRAKLPHIGAQEGLLRKLLYSIHGGVEKPAAVLWEDESEGAFQRVTMVLCPELKVALEISFRKRRPTVRRHRVIGRSVGNGVHLTESRFLTYVWRQGTAYPMDADQAVLFGCAANLVPELPVAPNLIDHGHTRPMRRSY